MQRRDAEGGGRYTVLLPEKEGDSRREEGGEAGEGRGAEISKTQR